MKASQLKQENRFFEKIAHRDKTYLIDNISFNIIIFHAVNNITFLGTGLHSHTTLELSLIEQGIIEYFTEDQNILAKQGNVFFMPPGIRHSWRVIKKPFVITGFQLNITPKSNEPEFLKYLQLQSEKLGYRLDNLAPIFAEKINEIRKLSRTQPQYFMEEIDCHITHLLIKFMQSIPIISPKPTSNEYGTPSNIIRVRIIKEFIKANLFSPLQLADVAHHLNVSTRQLNRIFTQQQHISLGQYILNQKIEAAKYELKNTDKLVKEIALELGFNDINYFSRIFKSKVGYSPTKYRTLT